MLNNKYVEVLMELRTQVQILEKVVCILLHTYALGKCMNLSVLFLSAMGK